MGTVNEIIIRISDDSPGDGSGAAFYSAQMFIDGNPSGMKPQISGGIYKEGVLMATAEAPIEMRYEIPDPSLDRFTKRLFTSQSFLNHNCDPPEFLFRVDVNKKEL